MSKDKTESMEKAIMVTHCSHCGGTCLLKVYVRDGVITRIETDDGEEPQHRGCARGRAFRQRVYAPDRLLYPMKRVGERGEAKFKRISWDEALDTVAGELTRIRETYGPESIIFKFSGGDLSYGSMQSKTPHLRLLNMLGGCSEVWGLHSFEGACFAEMATFGTVRAASNTRDDLLNSRLIIVWGANPAETVYLTGTAMYLRRAREAGAKVISVDPRYTRTAALCASQWIPIRPGTDAAMLMAMAYVIISERLQDQKFLDRYTVGFDKFKDYILGVEDGTPKTPGWAESITGVPAATIAELAREYATIKPAALLSGISPGRTAFGEQFHRATATLSAMTGNIGIHGGDAAINAYTAPVKRSKDMAPFLTLGPTMVTPPNPVEANAPLRKNAFPPRKDYTFLQGGQINQTEVADAILKGKAGGYPADYKMLYVVVNSYPNQYPNVNKAIKALKSKSLEFILVVEQFMSPGARFADILLPANTSFERTDITTGTAVGFYGYMGKVIDSLGESKSHLEIGEALAARLGIDAKAYNDKSDEEWVKQIALGSPHITDYEAFKKAGGYKVKLNEPYVAFKKQIDDPEHNPFHTPSGKIEIYSQQLADMNNPLIPPIPKYIETWESVNDPLAAKYPLQLVTTHFLRRAHSQYDNIPWLRELEPQRLSLNTADAVARGIKEGDMVRVFNDRGVTVLPAHITERVMPGVVDIPQGAWFDVDENGVDRGGSANILTKDEHSPGGAFVTNTCLVQVAKV